MHYICCSCNRGYMIWSLQRGWSPLGEVVNRSFTVVKFGTGSATKPTQKREGQSTKMTHYVQTL